MGGPVDMRPGGSVHTIEEEDPDVLQYTEIPAEALRIPDDFVLEGTPPPPENTPLNVTQFTAAKPDNSVDPQTATTGASHVSQEELNIQNSRSGILEDTLAPQPQPMPGFQPETALHEYKKENPLARLFRNIIGRNEYFQKALERANPLEVYQLTNPVSHYIQEFLYNRGSSWTSQKYQAARALHMTAGPEQDNELTSSKSVESNPNSSFGNTRSTKTTSVIETPLDKTLGKLAKKLEVQTTFDEEFKSNQTAYVTELRRLNLSELKPLFDAKTVQKRLEAYVALEQSKPGSAIMDAANRLNAILQ